jgi:restriction system protein
MGSVCFSVRDFFDSTTELIGIKSGLLLNRFQTSKILLEKYEEDFLKTDNLNYGIRLHSSEIEEMFLTIRQRIGNLPQVLPSTKYYKYLHEYSKKTGDIMFLASHIWIGLKYLIKDESITLEQLKNLIKKDYGLEDELCEALAFVSYEKNDLSCIIPSSKKWDGATELSKLFNCEVKSASDFLEQKFIDYLAVNGHEIEKIHWRNFERFCAEYFKKMGYHVVLGPGTNDGGVDIRVYNENSNSLELMIQCKRYDTERKIDIETVKSFYTDVVFEDARKGLIATTSYIAPGGKKVCETRGYNLTFAENENIKKWAREMWTYNN